MLWVWELFPRDNDDAMFPFPVVNGVLVSDRPGLSNLMHLESGLDAGLSKTRLRRRPPRMLCTKTQSMPKKRQLWHIGATEELCRSSSPSHLIFFSLHERQALRATGRFLEPFLSKSLDSDGLLVVVELVDFSDTELFLAEKGW